MTQTKNTMTKMWVMSHDPRLGTTAIDHMKSENNVIVIKTNLAIFDILKIG